MRDNCDSEAPDPTVIHTVLVNVLGTHPSAVFCETRWFTEVTYSAFVLEAVSQQHLHFPFLFHIVPSMFSGLSLSPSLGLHTRGDPKLLKALKGPENIHCCRLSENSKHQSVNASSQAKFIKRQLKMFCSRLSAKPAFTLFF